MLDFARTARLALAFADPSLRVVAAADRRSAPRPAAMTSCSAVAASPSPGRPGIVLGGLLLGTAALATEREERTLPRLLHGRLAGVRLVLAKVLFVSVVSLLLAILLVALQAPASGRGQRAGGRRPRRGRWPPAGAGGVLIAAFVRDLAAAAFVALLIAVPFLLAALVGRTGTGIARLGNVFPFGPATAAAGAALDGGDVAGPMLHLALLGLVATAIAAAYVRR